MNQEFPASRGLKTWLTGALKFSYPKESMPPLSLTFLISICFNVQPSSHWMKRFSSCIALELYLNSGRATPMYSNSIWAGRLSIPILNRIILYKTQLFGNSLNSVTKIATQELGNMPTYQKSIYIILLWAEDSGTKCSSRIWHPTILYYNIFRVLLDNNIKFNKY